MGKYNFMSIYVTMTENEILNTPNDAELGEKIRQRYWSEKEHESIREYDDERFIIVADETGLVKGIHLPKDLKPSNDFVENGYDKCVVCGKVSPYTTSTSIFNRIGYVEGAGQGCFQPNNCQK